MSILDWLLGRPLATREEASERIGVVAGVSVLGLDALASVAYGPEALLTVMLPLGAGATAYLGPLTGLIALLLLVVAFSYRQTIAAYPDGGGAYAVAKDNLGTTPALLAAAALALDYVLNVAVAISAGVGALVSAAPRLLPYTLPLGLAILVLLVVVNLRGTRESGAVFTAPTYAFLGLLVVVLVAGVARAIAAEGRPASDAPPPAAAAASTWLLVRAFASGCTAMTGIEAVSNGVPMFRDPSVRYARRTLAVIALVLAAALVAVAWLCRAYGIVATAPGERGYESVLSQLTAAAVGRGVVYQATMASVVVALALSANTSFAGLPRLCRVLAADRFLPDAFTHRGRRLVLSHGILALAVLAGALLVAFGGITDRLIPLFAIGAFLAFTMSQLGMVVRLRRVGGRGARAAMVVSGVGATATAVTLVIVLVSKFASGAWLSVLLVVALVLLFGRVRAYYRSVREATGTDDPALRLAEPRAPIAVVPVRRWDAIALKALDTAVALSDDVHVVQVITGDEEADDLAGRWDALVVSPARAIGVPPPRLTVLRSDYRTLFEPLLGFVADLAAAAEERQIAVLVPEIVPRRWHHFFFHGHTAAHLKELLVRRGGPQVIVVDTPWHLEDWRPERGRLLAWARQPRRA